MGKNLTRINRNWKHETTIFLCLLWPHPLDLYHKSNLSQESTADSTVYTSPEISKFLPIQNKIFFEPIWFAEFVKTQKPVHILTMEQQVFVPVVEDSLCGLCKAKFTKRFKSAHQFQIVLLNQSQEKVAKVVGSKNVFQLEWRPVTLWHMKKSSNC